MDGFVVVAHICAGALLVVTSGLMQFVVGPIVSKLNAEDKIAAQTIIRSRVEILVKGAILIQTATALYLFYIRQEMILSSMTWMAKLTFGALALTLANLMHFYWRGKRLRLAASAQTEKAASLGKRLLFSERVVFASALAAFLLGAVGNHFG